MREKAKKSGLKGGWGQTEVDPPISHPTLTRGGGGEKSLRRKSVGKKAGGMRNKIK